MNPGESRVKSKVLDDGHAVALDVLPEQEGGVEMNSLNPGTSRVTSKVLDDGHAVLKQPPSGLADVGTLDHTVGLASSEELPDGSEWFLFGFTNTVIEDAYNATYLSAQYAGCITSQVWKLFWLAWRITRITFGVNLYHIHVYGYILYCLVLLGAIVLLVSFTMKDRLFEWRRSLRALVTYDVVVTILIAVSAIYNSEAVLAQDGLNKEVYFNIASFNIMFAFVVPLVISFLVRPGFVINCIFLLATTTTFMWVLFSLDEQWTSVWTVLVTAMIIWVFNSIETQQRVALLKSLQYVHMERELQTHKETSLRAVFESVLRKQEKKRFNYAMTGIIRLV